MIEKLLENEGKQVQVVISIEDLRTILKEVQSEYPTSPCTSPNQSGSNEPGGYLYNLIRGELDLEKLDPMTFEEDAVNEILKAAINAGCKIVIIDNLTYLCSAMENAEAAGLVMKNLIAIKKQYGFSFLILAHTPKRNLWAKITQNDLAVSKRLYNLFDSVFAIGQSAKDENLRYIKQFKVRWGAKSFGELHVIIARIEKIDNFLQFVETGFAKEIELLIQNDEEIKEEINKQIMILRKQGKSLREIAKQTDTPKSTVDDIIKRNEKNK